ncbi:Gfo/Idh/MocA family protein [Terriglobus roseus]|uniref:Tat (Twin-arginine translocation) pathway signal sequence n=1 Tax=Terriglobus roseus TaxID=392734 RepID=A0A1H4SEU2_9BACT|nr:Gfo/Idh/MocA family oxidoreductase [Terriglobus roseus]SEC42725.1 Tat (twin-arginine translocation) pathway signal sequence [Terriglobus roseus]
MINRRDFIGRAAATAAVLTTTTAKSYARILGSNGRVNFAVIGLRSRAYAHLAALHANKESAQIVTVADVDSRYLDKFCSDVATKTGNSPKGEKDFRNALSNKDVDAITIATPDHWHAPMGILGMQAGKHVYVEKPCAYNPQEGLWLVEAQKKTGKLCQMGSQRRSSKPVMEAIDRLRSGVIGKPYWAETWYATARQPIGVGKPIPVPATLDWDLWQGPAPRQAYTDNVHPYNWHWFRKWGTGETLNNGTHEVDVAVWALGVGLPRRVTALGGRFQAKDDWQFYDNLDVAFEYPDAMITWKGSCISGKKTYGRDRGVAVHGTKGTMVIDIGEWEVYDEKDHMIDSSAKVVKTAAAPSSDRAGIDVHTDQHFGNFIGAIRNGEALHQPVAQGNISVTALHFANIAYFTKRSLNIDGNGMILGDKEAQAMTKRAEYAKGFEPKV